MSDIRIGQMSCEVLDVTFVDGGAFVLAIRLADGRTVSTNGRVVVEGEGPRSFSFDAADFHTEVMKGNVDIRAVCAQLGQRLDAAGRPR
jgi:hypothetical protein